ncbi:MAG: hypothetical protein JXB15_00485 [Anaerolineales bacterium]|nr:hypothetical protein [Anaerolineales bacterium]
MSQALLAILAFIAITVSLVAFFTILGIFFPVRIAKTKQNAANLMGRSLLVGLANLAFFVVVALVVFALGNRGRIQAVQIVGLIVLIPIALGVIFGLAGLVELVGEKLASGRSPLQRTAWGTVALALGCGLPFVGWFGLLPFAGLLGLGAAILTFFQRQPPAEPAVEDQAL